jgi:hypothetical protein
MQQSVLSEVAWLPEEAAPLSPTDPLRPPMAAVRFDVLWSRKYSDQSDPRDESADVSPKCDTTALRR